MIAVDIPKFACCVQGLAVNGIALAALNLPGGSMTTPREFGNAPLGHLEFRHRDKGLPARHGFVPSLQRPLHGIRVKR